jgi:hypothetical protein
MIRPSAGRIGPANENTDSVGNGYWDGIIQTLDVKVRRNERSGWLHPRKPIPHRATEELASLFPRIPEKASLERHRRSIESG